MRGSFLTFVLAALLGWAGSGRLWSQATPDQPGQPAGAREESSESRNLKAIRGLLTSMSVVEQEIQDLRSQLAATTTEAEREELNRQLEEKIAQLEQVSSDLGVIATGIDARSYEEMTGSATDLSTELEDFFRPIVGQLKELTAKPREIEDLRTEVSHHSEQIVKAKRALEHLDLLLETAQEDEVVDLLRTLRVLWAKRLEVAESDLGVAQFKLEEAQKNQSSLLSAAREAMASFFRNRGRNFITAVLAFFLVWFAIRLLYRGLIRWSPFHLEKNRNFYVRLVDIGVQVLALAAGAFATILVLYAASDWVLLGLVLIFLVGLAWTGKQALPHVYEQTKLMLNLGSVREGERVMVEGIPWSVKRINVYTDLVNPGLLGGGLRLPVRDLVGLRSRPFDPKEAWFPTEEGDWVVLSDDTYGRVIRQTPDWVTVIELGGARKVYPTADFLSLAPKNLSHNFRVRIDFGIDYRHQAISTTEVPEIFQRKLLEGLAEVADPEEIIHIGVEFSQAGASSLDYAVLADFAGSAGSKYQKLSRAISRICVDTCNEQEWVIPFTQITVHQAEAS